MLHLVNIDEVVEHQIQCLIFASQQHNVSNFS